MLNLLRLILLLIAVSIMVGIFLNGRRQQRRRLGVGYNSFLLNSSNNKNFPLDKKEEILPGSSENLSAEPMREGEEMLFSKEEKGSLPSAERQLPPEILTAEKHDPIDHTALSVSLADIEQPIVWQPDEDIDLEPVLMTNPHEENIVLEAMPPQSEAEIPEPVKIQPPDELSSPEIVDNLPPKNENEIKGAVLPIASAEQYESSINLPLQTAKIPEASKKNRLVMFSLSAKSGHSFAGYDLMQALLANGLHYDEKRIFHYYDDQTAENKILFSVASATEKGDFDLDNIGNFFCRGLILFSYLEQQDDPLLAFDLLTDTAMQLAEDLDGELKIDIDEPWDQEKLKLLRDEIL